MGRPYWPDFSQKPHNNVDSSVIFRKALREEWEHFEGYGWSDTKIAQALGVDNRTLQRYRRKTRDLREKQAFEEAQKAQESAKNSV